MINKNIKAVIIDYGAGNMFSVVSALKRLDIPVTISNKKDVIEAATHVIFPGVGHASAAMENLEKLGLDLVIPNLKQPVLGICLGMQLLGRSSEEGNTPCLHIFDLAVEYMKDSPKVPHMGWNALENSRSWLSGISEPVYFVHSYAIPVNPFTIAEVNHGTSFSAAIEKDNFTGCQFHPEKSGDIGSLILERFFNK